MRGNKEEGVLQTYFRYKQRTNSLLASFKNSEPTVKTPPQRNWTDSRRRVVLAKTESYFAKVTTKKPVDQQPDVRVGDSKTGSGYQNTS